MDFLGVAREAEFGSTRVNGVLDIVDDPAALREEGEGDRVSGRGAYADPDLYVPGCAAGTERGAGILDDMLGDGRVVEDELGACAYRVEGANWETGALLDGALIRGEDEYDFAYDGALRNPLDGANPRLDDIRGADEYDLELDGALRMALGAEPPREEGARDAPFEPPRWALAS